MSHETQTVSTVGLTNKEMEILKKIVSDPKVAKAAQEVKDKLEE